MCGICGVVGGDPEVQRAHVEHMNDSLAHRGPDGAGVWADARAVLANRRLAVIDPRPEGRQPMRAPGGELWITFNGEICNHVELRRDLEKEGVRFRTGTDTEVLAELVRREGAACLARLRGMFAFAAWDPAARRLFAARDAFGQKPFFYARCDGLFLFASEIKALLRHPAVPVEPELEAVDDYLGLRFIAPPLTMLRAVHKLPAGHWLEWRDGVVRIERWFAPRFGTAPGRSESDWIEGLRHHISEAVSLHTVSDVPVGAFLSGGLDSSVVVAAMTASASEPPRTFCVGSDVPGFDERGPARLMADHCGTRHEEVEASAALLARIDGLVRMMDEPADPIAACIDEAARLAARRVRVVLGGDGGDEVFAGFDRYAAYPHAARWAMLPAALRAGLVRPLLRLLPDPFAYKGLAQRLGWLDQVASERGGRLYARMTTHFRFGPEQKRWLYGPELRRGVDGRDTLAAIAEPFEHAPADSALDRMLYADLVTRLPEHTLVLGDRLGMAHGLEIRSPLLDPRLAEFCLSLPPALRVRRGTTKYALRRAAEPWLPPALLDRAKQGFMFPVAWWLQGEALGSVASRLASGVLVRRGWIEPAAVERLVAEHRSRRADHHVRLWLLASLDAWVRANLEKVDT